MEYGYDAAGNIIDITSQVFTEPPDITGLTPTFINIGRSINMLATGTDLLSASVTVTEPGFSVANVTSTLTEVSFTLTATKQASIGTATINFTTSLGSDSEIITVADRAPNILTVPNPIALVPDGQARTITILLDAPMASEETFDLTIDDGSFASLGQSSITLLAGETRASFELTGLTGGNTALSISSTSPLFNVSFPVYVTAPFSGDTYAASYPVGIIVGTEDPTGASEIAPLPSALVGLIVGTEDPTGAPEIAPLPSTLVGLIVGTEDPTGASEIAPLPSVVTGTIVGPVIQTLVPITAAQGDSITLSFTGINLQEVNAINITPMDNLTLGSLSINPGGTQVTVPLTIGVSAALGVRQVSVNTPLGTVPLLNSPPLELTIQ
ncbi:MAG: hypothetical protein O7D86_12040 [Proteobacteria bacterium]|nr:hypothetical protein [Pseudomonadota bacterium]